MTAQSRRSGTGQGLQGERLQKVLSRCGIASRREAERWLTQGRVSVNGVLATRLGTRVSPARDEIKVDGRRVGPASRRVYYLLNKPDGYVTTTRDPQGRPTIMDLARDLPERVYPAGRLDYHTTGLLLLTNDGDLADKLLRPATGCHKTYYVKTRGIPSFETLRRLSRGVSLDGRRTLPCSMRLLRGHGAEGNAWVEVKLREGRRNQIRKMFLAAGHPVAKLRRVAIGPITDHRLAPGQVRPLTALEIRRLREAVG